VRFLKVRDAVGFCNEIPEGSSHCKKRKGDHAAGILDAGAALMVYKKLKNFVAKIFQLWYIIYYQALI
jgi:hypothetical protein